MAEFDILPHESDQLEQLGKDFMAALALKESGQVNASYDALTEILKKEPRLAEPRMELARLLLDTDRVEEALEHARHALGDLNNHGQWIDDIPENTIKALSHALVAEALRRRIDEDDLIFGDPEEFTKALNESREHFAKAAELDPSDAYSSYHAVFMGPQTDKKS